MIKETHTLLYTTSHLMSLGCRSFCLLVGYLYVYSFRYNRPCVICVFTVLRGWLFRLFPFGGVTLTLGSRVRVTIFTSFPCGALDMVQLKFRRVITDELLLHFVSIRTCLSLYLQSTFVDRSNAI